MEATRILMDEHRVIERMLRILEKAAADLESGQETTVQVFIDGADFIRNFADGCHHRKEEGVLFKSMNSAGMPLESGPIAVMLHEHELGRKFTREMAEAAQKFAGGETAEKSRVIENARNYARLLAQHIQKEDMILFPMADRVIPQPLHDSVLGDFETVEHEETGEGVHEKYLALVDRLEADYLQ